MLDTDDNAYLEVPYRTLSRPTITLWEHKLARKRLREQRHAEVDEASLFAAIDELRTIEREASALTRTARRNRARCQATALPALGPDTGAPPVTSPDPGAIDPVPPFDDIESW